MKKVLVFLMVIIPLLVFSGCSSKENPNAAINCLSDADCVKAGCSGQLCIPVSEKDESGTTICDFKEEYACYSDVDCVCSSGACRWSDKKKLDDCVAEKSKSL